jgi:hypothetical protein
MLTPNGLYDPQNDVIVSSAIAIYTWSDTPATWGIWKSWYGSNNIIISTDLVWRSDRYDNGIPISFALAIEIVATGTVTYQISTSSTGLFAGEETTVSIAQGDSNIAGFFARYYIVTANVSANSTSVPSLTAVQITRSVDTVSEYFSNLDTSTLGGTITARPLPITRNYSIITNIDVSTQQVTSYALDVYVSNYATSTTVIPRVVSKTRTAPTIALLGIDGSTKNGTVDVVVTGLPEQYMNGNNLLIR